MNRSIKLLESLTQKLSVPSTILIVDDEPMVAEVLARICEVEGFRTIVVHSIEGALFALDENDVDLVFLDLSFEGKDGVDFLNAIRKKTTHPPIVVVSGRYQVDYLTHLAEIFPVISCVTKPFKPEKIRQVLSMFNLNPGNYDRP